MRAVADHDVTIRRRPSCPLSVATRCLRCAIAGSIMGAAGHCVVGPRAMSSIPVAALEAGHGHRAWGRDLHPWFHEQICAFSAHSVPPRTGRPIFPFLLLYLRTFLDLNLRQLSERRATFVPALAPRNNVTGLRQRFRARHYHFSVPKAPGGLWEMR